MISDLRVVKNGVEHALLYLNPSYHVLPIEGKKLNGRNEQPLCIGLPNTPPGIEDDPGFLVLGATHYQLL